MLPEIKEKVIEKVYDFLDSERSGGLLLLFSTLISLLISNSSGGEEYMAFWDRHLNLSFGPVKLDYSLVHWINDGLMTIFFLLVGLEIERELYTGELNDPKVASLPIAAAIGGILVPAAIHFGFNQGTATQSGIGVPMATDIAFALGMLGLLGKRVPFSLKIFLTALAIIDDLGAIALIAVFYSKGISWTYLLVSLGIFAALFILGKLKVYRLIFYLIPGVIMWYCMLKSGVHPTIAGVLLAFAIPFGGEGKKGTSYKLQKALNIPVAVLILPLFALANTGIAFTDDWFKELTTVNSVGIMAGLVIGKPLGIILFCFLLVKLGWGSLPEDVSWKQLAGAGVLAGIGFTMSIFISNLAFNDPETIQYSKVSVLVSAFISSVVGLLWLRFTSGRKGSS